MRLFNFHAAVRTIMFCTALVASTRTAPTYNINDIGVVISIPADSGGGECWLFKKLGSGSYGLILTCACSAGMGPWGCAVKHACVLLNITISLAVLDSRT